MDIAQLAAATDSQNVTLLTLFDCNDMAANRLPHRFAYVKAIKAALRSRVTIPELLAGFGTITPSQLSQALGADGAAMSQAKKDVEQTFGAGVTMKTSIEPVGMDSGGYYMAGLLDAAAGDQTVKLAVAIGITAIKGHVVSYNAYDDRGDLVGVKEVFAFTKTEVAAMLKANR